MAMALLSENEFLQKTTMASPYLQFDDIATLANNGGYVQNPALTQLSAVFLLSACVYLREKWLWQNPNYPINDATYDDIQCMIDECEAQLMTNIYLGQIISTINDLSSNDNFLMLNGQTVLQADYPELTAIVPASWLVGADIQLPDIVDGGVFGDAGYGIGEIIGENEVTLITDELPSHTHTQNPHSHSEVIPVVTTALGGEIPATASIVVPTASTTGITTATNQNTGNDLPHNNIQKSLTVLWFIVAR